MCENEPFVMERCFITEHLTDDEIQSLNDAIECYLNGAKADSDAIIAEEINRKMWKPIWRYRKALEDYYAEEDGCNAEQDN